MRRVVIMRGLPGSGKSRYVKALLEAEAKTSGHTYISTVCSADKFFDKPVDEIVPATGEVLKTTIYDFNPTKLPEAHSACMRGFVEALKLGVGLIVVDNTNIHKWEYQNYVSVATLAGYQVEIVEFRATTIEEVKTCIRRNTHKVPANVIALAAVEFEPDERAVVKNDLQVVAQ